MEAQKGKLSCSRSHSKSEICNQGFLVPKHPGRREMVRTDMQRDVRQERDGNRLKTGWGVGRGRMSQRWCVWGRGDRSRLKSQR